MNLNLVRSLRVLARAAAVGLLCAAAGLAQAAFVPFNATVDGLSQILEVIDPAGPVVRVQTLAFGSGSPGSLTYESGDILDLATGRGSGTNRFTTEDGDELFGSFTVQMVPGADASLFDLIGQVVFSGGTGDFLGATGAASFLAHGQFISAFEAVTHFEFEGRVSTVPEPDSAVLGLLGLVLCGLSGRAVSRQQDLRLRWNARRPSPAGSPASSPAGSPAHSPAWSPA